MYFITPSKPGIFLIGVYGNQLYGFGENKNKKLCIYSKSIFDCGDWDEFFVIDTEVVKAECCETGIHVAAGIRESTVCIAAREKEFTRLFFFDVVTNKLIKAKMNEQNFGEHTLRHLNLCSTCLMPIVRTVGRIQENYHFLITPRRLQKNTQLFQCTVSLEKNLCYTILKNNSIPFGHDPSSSIAIGQEDVVISVNERFEEENGRIKTLIMNSTNRIREFVMPEAGDSVWDDITFFNDNGTLIFALTQRRNVDSVTLRLYLIKLIDRNKRFLFVKSWTVDSNFPLFNSSPFFLAYERQHGSIPKFKFAVFQTPAGIVTMPLRMLSLSESAFLTLQKIPEPPAFLTFSDDAEDKHSASKKKVTDRWMSLNFIKKTMRLSNKFGLK